MNKIALMVVLAITTLSANAKSFSIESPNGKVKLNINLDENIHWQAFLNNKLVIEDAVIAMDFDQGPDLGVSPKLQKQKISQIDQEIIPGVAHKNSVIKDQCTQLTLTFKANYQLVFRAYNDGVAYHFIDQNKLERNLVYERMDLTFPESTTSLFPQEESMYSHNERLYLKKSLSEIQAEDFCSLPVMFSAPAGKVLFTETSLIDYPGMFLKGGEGTSMHTQFPAFVLKADPAKRAPDRNQTLSELADYIAQVEGARSYPWRVFMISNDDRTFVESNLTYQLSPEQAIENTDWIEPGQVAWDWYNANNIYGVDFEAGLNTNTYKYYIDFASKNNIRYVILDEGWTKTTTEILDFNPEMDVHELIRYAAEKNVGIILWVLWKPLDENTDEILNTYKSWGAKGIKVDFMQRNDQYMVRSYEKIAAKCADLELLVDFHGAFKPSGLRRKYPNVINYEGVRGAENNKWSSDITPEHNVTLPFIRMAAGPMDYTPGAMVNKNEKNHAISFERPMSLGTRAHQVAMYVVFEAPLQMLCESPSRYNQEQPTVDFITQIPTTWDETKVLYGKVGEYIAIARRKGSTWYIGAMTNWTERSLDLDLSFLGEGNFEMTIFKDGVNANNYAEDYKIEQIQVNQASKIQASLASGGGWSAIIKQQ